MSSNPKQYFLADEKVSRWWTYSSLWSWGSALDLEAIRRRWWILHGRGGFSFSVRRAVNGIMFVPHEGSLNEKFPEIKPKSVEEVVGSWKGK